MPTCKTNALLKFQHAKPAKPCYFPHPVKPIQYGATVQYADVELEPAPATKEQIKHCQQVIGTLLFYARAVDPTMLPALNTLAETQAAPTKDTLLNIKQLLDYAATNPNAAIKYRASKIHLWVDSNAAYLVAPKS